MLTSPCHGNRSHPFQQTKANRTPVNQIHSKVKSHPRQRRESSPIYIVKKNLPKAEYTLEEQQILKNLRKFTLKWLHSDIAPSEIPIISFNTIWGILNKNFSGVVGTYLAALLYVPRDKFQGTDWHSSCQIGLRTSVEMQNRNADTIHTRNPKLADPSVIFNDLYKLVENWVGSDHAPTCEEIPYVNFRDMMQILSEYRYPFSGPFGFYLGIVSHLTMAEQESMNYHKGWENTITFRLFKFYKRTNREDSVNASYSENISKNEDKKLSESASESYSRMEEFIYKRIFKDSCAQRLIPNVPFEHLLEILNNYGMTGPLLSYITVIQSLHEDDWKKFLWPEDWSNQLLDTGMIRLPQNLYGEDDKSEEGSENGETEEDEDYERESEEDLEEYEYPEEVHGEQDQESETDHKDNYTEKK